MRVLVIGAGNSGLAMAAHLSKNGESVILWNRTRSHIARLMETRQIYVEGVFNDSVEIDLVTNDMQIALSESDLIFITTPANTHKYLAELIAQNISRDALILLNPGRTFGVLEFLCIFKKFNDICKPVVAETQTIIYTCRKTGDDSVDIIALKSNVLLSTLNSSMNAEIIRSLPKCIQDHFIPADSIIETSIGNVGMILHCAPLLLNSGWTESENNHYKYYYDGITPTVSKFLEKMDEERVNVSIALGHPVESLINWLKRTYHVTGDILYECIQQNEAYRTIDAPLSLEHRYLLEDIPCGLVPLETIGLSVDIDMGFTTLIIDLASKMLGIDFRFTGRNLNDLGLSFSQEKLFDLEGQT